MKHIKTVGFCIFLAFAQAVASDSLLSQAQKLYSQGNFEAAAKAYGDLCPQLDTKEKRLCEFKEIKALTESRKLNILATAETKLLSLLSQTEPSDSLFAELSAEDAKLQLMLGQPVRAVRSWRAAQASANMDYFPELFVLCQDIISAFPENGLTAENCNRVKPADTTLISLPRKKVTPLATQQTAQQATPQSTQQTIQNTQPPGRSPERGQWYVQLGAFGNKDNAERLVANFKNQGVLLYIVEIPDRKLFAVRTGFFERSEDARIYAEQKIAPTHRDFKVLQ
ncbi:MAG: SPOR domain-containing protein [Fibromonadaceae bacterium]|jgi:cell division septation protein DedD|nr:SPOR domain-containing protein [Fibromonadaceae bacterium]